MRYLALVLLLTACEGIQVNPAPLGGFTGPGGADGGILIPSGDGGALGACGGGFTITATQATKCGPRNECRSAYVPPPCFVRLSGFTRASR